MPNLDITRTCPPLTSPENLREPREVRALVQRVRQFVRRWRNDANCCSDAFFHEFNVMAREIVWGFPPLSVRNERGNPFESVAERLAEMINFSNAFTYCADCGAAEFDGHHVDGLCRECFAMLEEERRAEANYERENELIYDYSTRIQDVVPQSELFKLAEGETRQPRTLYLGIELEVECRRDFDTSDAAETFLEYVPRNYAFCKTDGSLSRGFEICTIPATFQYHHETWSKLLDADADALRMVQRSHSNTGMHVHMSREGFTPLTLGKFLVFYNHPKNEDFIFAASGRNGRGSFDQWARANIETKITDPLYGSECNTRFGKYSAVNCTPSETVEIRIFQGSRDKAVFLRNLEFVQASYEFCRETPMKALGHDDFSKWVMLPRNERRFENLANWLVDRGYATRPENPANASLAA